jgi:hypothetical protein
MANTSATGSRSAAFRPNPQQLALASTVAVHPQFTTRAKGADDLNSSTRALSLLHDVNRVLGPCGANVSEGIAFNMASLGTRRGSKKRTYDDALSNDDEDQGVTKSVFANDKSMFAQVEDVWQMIGWAFNCSVKFEKRWAAWMPWLQYLADTLETDWEDRELLSEQQALPDPLKGSLMLRFVEASHSRTALRRILRAILANGDVKSLNEFREVWTHETKERKQKDPLEEEKKELNLDEGLWGDYDINEDEDEVDEDPTPEQQSRSPSTDPDSKNALGGIDSIKLRVRFIKLVRQLRLGFLLLYKLTEQVVEVARVFPEDFANIDLVLDVCTEAIEDLNLVTFKSFLANLAFEADIQSAFLVNIALLFLPQRPSWLNVFTVKQEQLCSTFLPSAAKVQSVSGNAKMSLILEALLLNTLDTDRLEANDALLAAVEKGIQSRKSKAVPDGRRRGKGRSGREQDALEELEMSSERIRAIVEILEMSKYPLPKPFRSLPYGADIVQSPASNKATHRLTRPRRHHCRNCPACPI